MTALSSSSPPLSSLWRQILVPMDFSPPSEAALLYALTLARASGATVHVCHVIPSLHLLDALYEHGLEQPESVARITQKAQQRVAELVTATREEGTEISVQVHCSEGDVAQGVLEWAATLHPDLIVMGTHGRRGAPRFFLGSVTETVVRRAPCPVLTLRDPAVPLLHPADTHHRRESRPCL
ncbi:MAG: universal stress protein [Candidatus Binatia bacterium]|nr:universal stress protein [Candidatus Binatia bacterium]